MRNYRKFHDIRGDTMTLAQEDLQAISTLMDEKLKSLDDRMQTLEIKFDIMSRKLDDIDFRLTSLEHTNKKEFGKINDKIETLIAELEARDILPKQA